jgi:hypothetical protein
MQVDLELMTSCLSFPSAGILFLILIRLQKFSRPSLFTTKERETGTEKLRGTFVGEMNQN